MKSLHVEGTGWFYRVSPRLKLLTLMGFSIALFLTRDLVLLGCAAILAAVILRETRLPFREIGLRLRPVMLTILLVAAFSYLLLPAQDASVNLLRLTALALLATAVTITVSISQFMDEITLATAPLERLGLVKAADIGLAVGLVVRFVPEIVNRYHAVRDAHWARGLPVRMATIIVPLVIMTLKDADAIADAIDARGFRGQSFRPDNHPEF
ncbi:energy-coupling factor transporter transmembrane component T family protein [Agrobacterium fabrum]|jgi:biotin transport system permease protein|uniref:Biotin transport system permease protein n=1 Tax=Agrobacterium fabrum TaxID=1176649 RepID=A0A7Z7BL12_9HYPH|nr:energy-coupling factor transporter transmembrane protein EcfT [Agrobacterium fabrum]MCR6723075.1 energy-coupling factor transporter transmembrane protein EcfT [Agrobacterium fabrum]WCK76752.1 energy-coupling factor transporter transmembrane protein EcfT [Agrobacterium fabrum]WIE27834.1 energy-coupling factor transporter transmembrane protein EcfT [Agrobacterium fabrum]WIE43793.1 energy-coupling factor transporter transmembrane protein EcfT [Agrobacterium fabrum]CUX24061.1 Energy-coupling fa